MNKQLNIGFTYNVKHTNRKPTQKQTIAEAEFDTPEVITGIQESLENLGYNVYPIEANDRAYFTLHQLKNKLDLVFNFAEGMHGDDREAHIPAMLEMLQIPYTGGTPLSYALGLNKGKCKEILTCYHIPTPQWQVFRSAEDPLHRNMHFPLIVKPLHEGSSKGIHADCLVHNKRQLQRIIKRIRNHFEEKAIVEEFLSGREFTVAVLGTPLRVLPIIEVTFHELPDHLPKFDHYEAKWILDSPENNIDPLICPAKIPKSLKQIIEKNVLFACTVLGIKDWARFDLRLDSQGAPNILEVNCPPGVLPNPKENSRFPRAACVAGLNFEQMLNEIINSCRARYHIR